MESDKNIVQFSIAKVTTEQFAIIEEAFREGTPINLGISIRFSIDRDKRVVAVFCQFQFEHEQDKVIPFLKVEVSNQFVIALDSWSSFLLDDITTVVPRDFMIHLTMITVGTARGVLHTKTQGTRFNEFILPTINVKDIIKEDVSFAETVSTR